MKHAALAERGARTGRLVLGIVMCASLAGGCGGLAPAAKTVAKSTIRGTYDEIDAIDEAQQDRVVKKLLDSPAVHAAAHDLLSSVVSGAIDGMTESERTGKISAFVDASLDVVRRNGDAAMGDMVGHLDKQLSPMLRSLIDELISSVSKAMREAAARDLPIIMEAVLNSALRAFAMSAATVSVQAREQARLFAEQDLGPIAGTLAEQVARQAVVGVREGIHRELDLKDPAVRDGMREMGIGLAQGIAQGTPTSPFTTTFAIATFVFGTLFLLTLGAAIALYSRDRTNARTIALLARRAEA